MRINKALFTGALTALACLSGACSKEEKAPLVCIEGAHQDKYLLITTTSAMQAGKFPVYMITESVSYESSDTTHTLNIDSLHFEPLTAAQHLNLGNFLHTLPVDSLLASGKHTFGCLSCADEPVWILAYKAPGQPLQTWQIDSYSIPAYMEDYLEQLRQQLQKSDLW
jgi:hypothetical protein